MIKLQGSLKISGDKSISHRALIFAALSVGESKIRNLLESRDVFATINILKELGIKIRKKSNFWVINGNGTDGFLEPNKALNCENSGTTARLMIGAVASNPISCTFTGDKSLSKRSMSRVTNYLEKIGAETKLTKEHYLPLMITGSNNLLPFSHSCSIPSAQIKSALILSGLNIKGKTTIIEKRKTRDHTERLMKYLNLNFKIKKFKNKQTLLELNGPYEIKSKDISVASDPSSAAFFIVGALITPGSKIKLTNIALNPTRIEYIKILKKMGGNIRIKKTRKLCGEDVGTISVKSSKLKGINIDSKLSPLLIDEYPILSIAATQAKGAMTMKGLGELRHKESDRIKSIVINLNKLGFNVEEKNDNITIRYSKTVIKNVKKIRTYGDHRIAMSFSILNLLYKDRILIDDKDCIAISYPKFFQHLKQLQK